MSRHALLTTRMAALLACALAVAGCDRGAVTPHDALSADAEPLRSHFNRDVGLVRIVLLAAPT